MKENSITLPGRLILILPEGSRFPGGASGKEPACQCGRRKTQVWPEWGRSPWRDGIATHSSILAWRIPWTEKPGRLQSTGSQRARHAWSDFACSTKDRDWLWRTHFRFSLPNMFHWLLVLTAFLHSAMSDAIPRPWKLVPPHRIDWFWAN